MERPLAERLTNQKTIVLESWFVAKNTGDIYDMMMLIQDLNEYDSLLSKVKEQEEEGLER